MNKAASTLRDYRQFYIDGRWVDPLQPADFAVENPSTEQAVGVISLGARADIDRAVSAARRAFADYSLTAVEQRLEWLQKLLAIYMENYDEMGELISLEMGAPIDFAIKAQAARGNNNLSAAIEALKGYKFESRLDEGTTLVKEPIGVCGLITPWNWPINQLMNKVAPALATGCTLVLKPSEMSPMSAGLFAQLVDQAGFPAGVFNLVNGEGPVVGMALAEHPDIDMVSITGSTRAGIAVARAAADTVKRVCQELGGKSANIILDDADLERAVTVGVKSCFYNSGQSCNAPTRMLVPRDCYQQAVEIACREAEITRLGHSQQKGHHLGPVINRQQFDKIQSLIESGMAEGARLVAGGPGRPEGFERGYFVRPTIFADVQNNMTIAREEIFGPVLVMIPYRDEDEAVSIANDSPYGLFAYIQSGDSSRAQRLARRLRAGSININGASQPAHLPFGGYKQSGNGREGGGYGFEEYLETKVINEKVQ